MMPGLAVLEIAPANVLQGAVRLQGFKSSPTPESHVRVAWALAMLATMRTVTENKSNLAFIETPPSNFSDGLVVRDDRCPNVGIMRRRSLNESQVALVLSYCPHGCQ